MHVPTMLRAAMALVLAVALAACSQPPPIDTRTVVSGTATGLEDVLPLGVAFMMVDETGLSSLSLSERSAFIEVFPGVFIDSVAPIDADGAFSLVLPDVDDVPSATFVDVEDFYYNLSFGAGDECALIVSDPAARVSFTAFELITLPGFLVYTIEGVALATLSSEPIDFDALESFEDLEGIAFVTWIAADRPVEVTTNAACDADGVSVDLTLGAGWNQVAFELGAESYSMTNDDGDEFFLSVLFF